ncbi:MAG: ester cyclase [Ktedonobacterales bacterium]
MSVDEQMFQDRRFFEEVNRKNLAISDELMAPDFVSHSPTGTTQGLEAFKQYFSGYFIAFPDLQFTMEEQLAMGHQCVVQWTARGTHQGMLAGIAPTGKSTTISGVTISHWAHGKVIESWVYFDNLGLMQQLGVIPTQLG